MRVGFAAWAAVLMLSLSAPLLTTPRTALAHTVLTSSSPTDGQQLAHSPGDVELMFSETIDPTTVAVSVADDKQQLWSVTNVHAEDRTVSAHVGELGEPGHYLLNYRVVATDGHPITGSVTFFLTDAEHGQPAAAPTATSSTRAGLLELIAAFAALASVVAVAGALWWRKRD